MKFKAFLAQFLALNLLLPMSAVSIHAENNATNTNTTLNETQKDDIHLAHFFTINILLCARYNIIFLKKI